MNSDNQEFDLNSPSTKKLIAIVLSSFLITFTVSRLFVYLIINKIATNFFLVVRGVHIHHFTYGFFILAIVGLYLILKHPPSYSKQFRWLAWFYGIGLGLATDEFGMWIRLEDEYWVRQSYDAVIIISLVLLNIAYFKQIITWTKEMIQSVAELLRSERN